MQEAALDLSEEPLINPGRGWYQVFPLDVCQPVDEKELYWCLDREDTLALLMLDIGEARNRKLREEELERIRSLFAFFRHHGQDLILRVVYDREGNGPLREPSTISGVLEHMRQIGPLIREFSGSILVVQGLFIGSWGEMHSSAYASPNQLRVLANTLWKAMEGSCVLAVRKPVHWRMLHSPKEQSEMQMALFDDGMFGSFTHLGTFGGSTLTEKRWEEPWSTEEELEFEAGQFVRVPNGGEALSGENLSFSETVRRLQKMHVCYLNKKYEEKRLQIWKAHRMENTDGQTGYDWIGNRLGYRFTVRAFDIKRKAAAFVEKKPVCCIMVWIENIGFGNLCQPAECYLVLRRDGMEEQKIVIKTDPCTWDCGVVTEITGEIPMQKDGVKIYLVLERKADHRMIFFANTGSENGVLLGTFTE